MLSGDYAKFTQIPAMKHHLLSTGNKRLAKPALRTQCGALVSARIIPEPTTHDGGEGNILLGESLPAVRGGIHDRKTGLAHPGSAGRFRTPTGNVGIHEIFRPRRSRAR